MHGSGTVQIENRMLLVEAGTHPREEHMKKVASLALITGGLLALLPAESRAHPASQALTLVPLAPIAMPVHHDPRCARAPRCKGGMVAVCMHAANRKWTGVKCCSRWKCSPGPF